jgi:uncharacterized protein (TIGR02246 family)
MTTLDDLAAEIDALRQEVQLLADREEIRSLTKEYARTLDARDLRAFSLLFAREGSWVGGSGAATGPEAIQSMLEKALSDNRSPHGPTLYHLTTDPEITVLGDHATGACFWMHVRRDHRDAPTLPTLGHYDDRYVREAGRWRFLERKVSSLMAS